MNFGKLIKIASIQLAREMDTFTHQYQLTGTQMSILNYLYEHSGEDISQKDLVTEFGVKGSTMSVIVHRMEERNLVTRQIVGRQKYLNLTPNAQTYITAIQNFFQKDNERLIAGFDTNELAVIAKFLQQIGGKHD